MKRYVITYKREPMDCYSLKIVNIVDNTHKTSMMRRTEFAVADWLLEPLMTAQFLQKFCSRENPRSLQKCEERELEIMNDMLKFAQGCDDAWQYDFRNWWKKNGFEARYAVLQEVLHV